MRHRLAVQVFIVAVSLLPQHARAQWPVDGVPLCTTANNQEYEALVSIVEDGAGGAIVAWQDYRSATTSNIYAQRVNALGVPQWTVDGVALCTAAGNQENPAIVSDNKEASNTGVNLAPALMLTCDDGLQPGMVLSIAF